MVNFRVGRRKALAMMAVGVVAAVSVAAWLLLGTDGLLAVLIVNSLAAPLVLGWLIAQAERRTRVLVTRIRDEVAVVAKGEQARLDDLSARLDDLDGQAAWSGEQAERLLVALNARLTRTEMLQARFFAAFSETVGRPLPDWKGGDRSE